jgi:hypothetical protein
MVWLEEMNRKFVWEGDNVKEVFALLISGLEVDFLLYEVMAIVTEGGRRVLSYKVLSTEDEGRSRYGLGYNILLTNNNQKARGEGIRWRRIFASFIRKDDLEAGAKTDLSIGIPTKEIQIELSKIINPKLDGKESASDNCGDILCLFERLSHESGSEWSRHNKFEKMRMLMGICLMCLLAVIHKTLKEAMKADLMIIGILILTSEDVCGSDCSGGINLMEELIIRWKKELRFRRSRLTNKKVMINVTQLVEQSTNNLILVSIVNRGFSKSNIFYYIDQLQEHIGSEASSSSEDG